jgi:hypothetical protein
MAVAGNYLLVDGDNSGLLKYWWERMSADDRVAYLNKKDIARLERCFGVIFGIPLGRGALLNLEPRMAYWTSVGLFNLVSLKG